MSGDLATTIIGGLVVVIPAIGGGVAFLISLGRKLGAIEALATKELTHNGGGSMKDYTRDAKGDATAARAAAEDAKDHAARLAVAVGELDRSVHESRAQRERDTGALDAQVAKVQHDLTNLRVGQGYLVHQLDRMDEQRLAREATWALSLREQGLTTPTPLPTQTSRPLPDALSDVVP